MAIASMHAEAVANYTTGTEYRIANQYRLKILRIFLGLEKFTLKNFDPSKMPLKTYFQFLI